MKAIFDPTAHTEIGSVNTLSSKASYQSDPLTLFKKLCGNKSNNLLLESAEIDKKHQLKSLLLVDAAVKIVCHGNQVSFTPLSVNGEAAISFTKQQLEKHATVTIQGNNLHASFAETSQNLDEKSRLLATNPFHSLRIFQQLKNETHHPFAVFLGGAFAFDMITMSEQLPAVKDGDNTCPDFVYYLAETLVVIDHEKRSSEVIANVFSGPQQQKCHFEIARRLSAIKALVESDIAPPQTEYIDSVAPSEVTCDISDEEFCKTVITLKEHIKAGDIFQVVPSRTFSLPCEDTFNAYLALRESNPSPYMFYFQDEDFCMFGASPESAIKYQQHNRQVEIYPIAGTRPRGYKANGDFSLDLDCRIELELRQDKKELSEHIMLVDLARNDVARVSKAGTRHVADLLKVDRYSHVMHLVSRVCGTLSDDLDALHAYQACMNMGTLSGAPKVRATELIRQFEGKRRGSYGGAVGYLTGEGDMDTCIVIRSAFVKNQMAHVQAGAGVVFDSNPQAEADETRQKAQAVINAIKKAARMKNLSSNKHTNNKQEAK
ncbi:MULTISPECIES: anthranilate synthase component 1 [Thalassotalea]|uniref:Anthranilate synthase component 1 n=1 Tax=Thalassotalea castellviae TaxID=3075612 RepID=A0ABU3A313_9GAMM|nr:anthranilate synthase component 1 [Thalassotalea sp. W431]MDT0604557.1 anthranilate synthase component 1 [Thalassotalea sp. W431]